MSTTKPATTDLPSSGTETDLYPPDQARTSPSSGRDRTTHLSATATSKYERHAAECAQELFSSADTTGQKTRSVKKEAALSLARQMLKADDGEARQKLLKDAGIGRGHLDWVEDKLDWAGDASDLSEDQKRALETVWQELDDEETRLSLSYMTP